MDRLLDTITQFDFQHFVTLILVVWYFNRDVKKSIDNLDKDIRTMNTRISRVEGTVYGKEVYKHIEDSK